MKLQTLLSMFSWLGIIVILYIVLYVFVLVFVSFVLKNPGMFPA